MHALIIEDEPLIAMAIEEVLRDCGFTSFDVAVSADEAVAAAARKVSRSDYRRRRTKAGLRDHSVQSICSERPIPVLFITGSPGEVRVRMPGHRLVEKPFDAGPIKEAISLAMDNGDG